MEVMETTGDFSILNSLKIIFVVIDLFNTGCTVALALVGLEVVQECPAASR